MQGLKIFFAIFLCLSGIWPLSAHAQENFTIKQVEISRSAANSELSRVEALEAAQEAAFKQLLESITLPQDRSRIPDLSSQGISNLVAGYEVADEKVGEKTYKASFTVTFDRKKVEGFLNGLGVTFVENVSPSVLVLPIFQKGSEVLLWEKANIWRDAWAKASSTQKTLPLVVPLGDLEDITLVGVEDAFSGQFSALSKLAKKYDAGRVLIAEAVYEEEPVTKRPTLEVILRVVQKETILDRSKHTYNGQVGMDKKVLLERSAKEAIVRVAESLKNTAIQQSGESKDEQQITVDIPINNIAQWHRLKKDITKVQGVKAMRVENIASNRARATLTNQGDFSTLTYFLHQSGYVLKNNKDGQWWLTPK